MSDKQKFSKLQLPNDQYIAYQKTLGKKNDFGIIFLGGFMSDMAGTKATALEQYCKENSYNFIRFDYLGHGESSGEFTDFNISRWKQNVLDVIDNLTVGPQILIGSSMGSWLMLLAALDRKDRICGAIGIASAPDFTKDIFEKEFNEEQRELLYEKNIVDLQSEYSDCPYPITKDLIEDGKKNLLLDEEINLQFPFILIHGTKDGDVPFQKSITLKEKLLSKDVKLILCQEGDHRMSKDEDIELIYKSLEEIVAKCSKKV